MRWPWHRERPEHPSAEAARQPAAWTAAVDRVPPAGWAFLPPLQRTIGSVQLTSDPGRFAGALSSWSDPSLTGRMAHLVSAQAPPGVIDVDGGGPVPASGYPTGSGEMTLPPPAPAVRPTPAGYGSNGATAQRFAPVGSSPDGGSLEGGSPDGGSLLAAGPTALPVLHLDPSPLQRSDSRPQADPMTLARSLPDSEVSGPAAFLPDPGMFAPDTGPEVSPPGQVGGPVRPQHDSSSISDGRATYVEIPSAPAVQRTSPGPAGSAPTVGNVQRSAKLGLGMPRLGLGMPLSFSEPATEPAAAAEPPSGHFPEPFPLPVQRASTSGSPVWPSPHPAGGDGWAVERALPESGVGAAQQATDGTTEGAAADRRATNLRATSAAGTSDPPSPDRFGGLDVPQQQTGPEATSGHAPDAAVLQPSEAESAPLLSAAGSAGNLGLESERQSGEDGAAPQSTGTSPAMPVVFRLSSDVPRTALVDPGNGSEQDSAGPGRPLTPDPGSAGTSGVGPAATPSLQRDPSVQSNPSLQRSPSRQRNVANDAPVASVPRAGDSASRAELPLPPRGPTVSGSTDGLLGSGQADAGKLKRPAPPTQLSVPGVQRAPEPGNAPQGRAVPTSAGPVVLRVVQSAWRDSTPEAWQRLAVMPVVALPAGRLPAAHLAGGVRGELSSAEVAGSWASSNNVAAEPSSTDRPATVPAMPLVAGGGSATVTATTPTGPGIETDSGAGTASDLRAAGTPDPEEAATFDAVMEESAEPSAAVGRVIQRTISVPGAATADGAAIPASGSPAHMLTGVRTPAPQTPGPRPPSVILQRSGASVATIPESTRSAPSPRVPEPGFAGLVPIGLPAAPAAGGALTGSRPETSVPLTLNVAAASSDRGQNRNVLQREAEFQAPDSDTAAPGPPGPATSAPEGADGGSPVQGAESAPTAQGLPGPAAKGSAAPGGAAPGNAAQASPEQLEELAKRLAGPLIRRIKAEMLLDRERRGLRTDVN